MAGLMRFAAWILATTAIALTGAGAVMLFWKDMVPLAEFQWNWLVYYDLAWNLGLSLPLVGLVLMADARVVGGGPYRWRWWTGAVLLALFLLAVVTRSETWAGKKYLWVPELLFWGRVAAVWPIWYFATRRAEQRRRSAG